HHRDLYWGHVDTLGPRQRPSVTLACRFDDTLACKQSKAPAVVPPTAEARSPNSGDECRDHFQDVVMGGGKERPRQWAATTGVLLLPRPSWGASRDDVKVVSGVGGRFQWGK